MKGGQLRHRLIFAAQVLTVDDFGQQTETFNTEDQVTVWGSVTEIATDEKQNDEGTGAQKKLLIRARYSSEIAVFNTSSRVTYNFSNYNILSVVNVDGCNQTLEFIVEKIL